MGERFSAFASAFGHGLPTPLILVLLLACMTNQLAAVSGIIPSQTWSGLVTVEGDVVLPEGETLTIEPGTEIRFTAQSSVWDTTDVSGTSNRCDIVIFGRLDAIGSPSDSILFTSDAAEPASYDWGKVLLISATDSSEIGYTALRYGNMAIHSECPILDLHHCSFLTNSTAVYLSQATARVDSCTIQDCYISFNVQDSGPVIQGCSLDGARTIFEGTTTPEFRQNLLVDTWVECGDGTRVLIEDNVFDSTVELNAIDCNTDPPDEVDVGPTIRNNLIQGAGLGKGIYLYENNHPGLMIEGNTIAGWEHGVYAHDSRFALLGNTVRNCSTSGIYTYYHEPGSIIGGDLADANDIYDNVGSNLYVGGSQVLPATHNYWGTTDELQVVQTLQGAVGYTPWTDAGHSQVFHTSGKLGMLTSDSNWSGEIILRGDVLVPSGITLTIEQGTVVKAWSRSTAWDTSGVGGSDGRCDIVTYGKLLILGAPSDSVRFVSDSETPGTGDWGRIVIRDGADSSSVSYASISHAQTGLHINNASPHVEHVGMRDLSTAVLCDSSASAIIELCDLEKSITISRSDPTISACSLANGTLYIDNYADPQILMNSLDDMKITCDSGARPLIEGNTLIFTGEATAIQCYTSNSGEADVAPTIRNNTIHGAGSGLGIYLYRNAHPDLLIEGNTISGWANGINQHDSHSTIRGNSISGCTTWGIYSSSHDVGSVIGGSLEHANDLYDNGGNNLYVSSSYVMPATHNYWGTTVESEILETMEGPVSYSPWTDSSHEQLFYTATQVGVLEDDVTWSGTVLVRGDVVIPDTVTLTIDPGTLIKFSADGTLWDTLGVGGTNGHCDLIAYGTLLAQGTSTDSIYFLSDAEAPGSSDWGRVVIRDQSNLSHLSYASIRHANSAFNVNNASPNIENVLVRESSSAVYCDSAAAPTFDSCDFERNVSIYRSAPVIANSSFFQGTIAIEHQADPVFMNNEFLDVSIRCRYGALPRIEDNFFVLTGNQTAITCYGHESDNAPTIKGNEIEGSGQGTAVYLDRNDHPDLLIDGNTIEGCEVGIYQYDSRSTITGNTITNCTSWAINSAYHVEGSMVGGSLEGANNIHDNAGDINVSGSLVLSATHNYWGTTDENEIVVGLEGPIDYSPWTNAQHDELFHTASQVGVITENASWSDTVYVRGDVVVPHGVTLTIDPAAVIKFSANATLWDTLDVGGYDGHCDLIVYGKLMARGTPTDSIHFISDAEMPESSDWGKIVVRDGVDSSHVAYASIQHANTGLYMNNASPRVEHTCIREISTAVWCDSSAAAIIDSCDFRNYFRIYRSDPEISSSIFTNSYIYFEDGAEPDFLGNTLVESRIHCRSGSRPLIEGNSISVATNNTMIDCSTTGGNDPDTAPVIRDNVLQGSGEGMGIYIYYNTDPDLLIEGNTFSDLNHGIYQQYSTSIIRNNTISGCGIWGIESRYHESGSLIGGSIEHANNIYGNSGHNLYVVGPSALPATHNYWGTVIEREILETIEGSVDYSPWTDAGHEQLYYTATKVGVIEESTTWSDTILVRGDVVVPDSVTLTIDPGTVVRFSANATLWDTLGVDGTDGKCDLVILGRLLAEGTPSDSIIFISDADTHQPGEWGRIVIRDQADSSHVAYTSIRHASTALRIASASPHIEHMRVREVGSWTYCDDSASPQFYSCVLTKSASIYESNPLISGCTFTGDKIYIRDYSEPVITGNTLVGTSIDCQSGSRPLIEGNNFTASTSIQAIRCYTSSGADVAPTIRNNDLQGSGVGYGIYIYYNQDPDLLIEGNTISGWDRGIYGVYSHFTLRGNSITDCTTWGIYSQNHIEGSAIGGSLVDANDIHSNGRNIQILGDRILPATYNYWGSTVEDEFVPGISGPVNYSPWTDASHSGVYQTDDLVGVLQEDTNLSGTSQIRGDLVVSEGITLTIEPGAEILFWSGATLWDTTTTGARDARCDLIVYGTLVAQGTAEQIIRFKSDDPEPSTNQWGSVIVSEQAEPLALSHLSFANGYRGLYLNEVTAEISDCEFEKTSSYCVYAQQAESLILQMCDFSNVSSGVYADLIGNLVASDCDIGSSSYGIRTESTGVTIENSRFNAGGGTCMKIQYPTDSVLIRNNEIASTATVRSIDIDDHSAPVQVHECNFQLVGGDGIDIRDGVGAVSIRNITMNSGSLSGVYLRNITDAIAIDSLDMQATSGTSINIQSSTGPVSVSDVSFNTDSGTGFYLSQVGDPLNIDRCSLNVESGKGMYIYSSSPEIDECIISVGDPTHEGIGLECSGSSEPRVRNTIITNVSQGLFDNTGILARSGSSFDCGVDTIWSGNRFVGYTGEDNHYAIINETAGQPGEFTAFAPQCGWGDSTLAQASRQIIDGRDIEGYGLVAIHPSDSLAAPDLGMGEEISILKDPPFVGDLNVLSDSLLSLGADDIRGVVVELRPCGSDDGCDPLQATDTLTMEPFPDSEYIEFDWIPDVDGTVPIWFEAVYATCDVDDYEPFLENNWATRTFDVYPPLALIARPADGAVFLEWNGPGPTGDLGGYNIYRGTAPGIYDSTAINGVAPVPQSPFIDNAENSTSPPENGETYYYVVKARYNSVPDSLNETASSNEATAKPQVITLAPYYPIDPGEVSNVQETGTIFRYYADNPDYDGPPLLVTTAWERGAVVDTAGSDGVIPIDLYSNDLGERGRQVQLQITELNRVPLEIPLTPFIVQIHPREYSEFYRTEDYAQVSLGVFVEQSVSSSLDIEFIGLDSTEPLYHVYSRGLGAGTGVDCGISAGFKHDSGLNNEVHSWGAYGGVNAELGIRALYTDSYRMPHSGTTQYEDLAALLYMLQGFDFLGRYSPLLVRCLAAMEKILTDESNLEEDFAYAAAGVEIFGGVSTELTLGGSGGSSDCQLGYALDLGGGGRFRQMLTTLPQSNTRGAEVEFAIEGSFLDQQAYPFGCFGGYFEGPLAVIPQVFTIIDPAGHTLIAEAEFRVGGGLILEPDATSAQLSFGVRQLLGNSYNNKRMTFTVREEEPLSEIITSALLRSAGGQSLVYLLDPLSPPIDHDFDNTGPVELFRETALGVLQHPFEELRVETRVEDESFDYRYDSAALGIPLGSGLGSLEIKVKGTKEVGARYVDERSVVIDLLKRPVELYPESPLTFREAFDFEAFLIELWDRGVEAFYGILLDVIAEIFEGALTLIANTAELIIPDGAMEHGETVGTAYWTWDTFAGIREEDLSSRDKEILRMYRDMAREQARLDYGVGGIYHFTGTDTILDVPATLTIGYADSEVVGMDESRLAIYYWDGAHQEWILQGGAVDTLGNTVTTTIDTLRLYAIAPVVPTGDFGLNADPDSLPADGSSLATVTSDLIHYNNGDVVDDGTIFSVFTSVGEVTTADLDTIAGVQLPSTDGRIAFEIRAPEVGWPGELQALSLDGEASGSGVIVFVDSIAPPAPVIVGVTPVGSTITISWDPVEAVDIGGYQLYYDIDQSGPPYDGELSLDSPSPIDVGLVTTRVLSSVLADTTYYIAVAAYDVAGNWSPLSQEVQVGTPSHVPGTDSQLLPQVTRLRQNRPNPFNPRTTISYDLARAGKVNLTVYDVSGRVVRTLLDQDHPPGRFSVQWEGRDNYGHSVAAGVYFTRLTTPRERKTIKMVLIK